MAEYIDKAEYCEKHCRCSNEYCDRQSCPIWKAPAADVVPVVRCKDCIYEKDAKWNKKGFRICTATHMEIVDDDFCSYGERKEKSNDTN